MANVDQYFDSYDNLEVHRLMLSDKPRTESYKKAILQNASYFKNKVVMGKLSIILFHFFKIRIPIFYFMSNVNNFSNCSTPHTDIGAGTGILSLFAKSAGASRVYAVEASPMAVHLKNVILKNKAEDVVKVLHQMVEDVELTEKVDIIIRYVCIKKGLPKLLKKFGLARTA